MFYLKSLNFMQMHILEKIKIVYSALKYINERKKVPSLFNHYSSLPNDCYDGLNVSILISIEIFV
jgi:hypothetical protein